MAEPQTFQVERRTERGSTVVLVRGIIDENADISFFNDLSGHVVIDLAELRRINSHGVREWVRSIESVPADTHIELRDCPPPFVDQANLVSGFTGRAKVTSFLATYLCDMCDHEMDERMDSAKCKADGYALPATMTCPECGDTMEPNVVESLYTRFLREQD